MRIFSTKFEGWCKYFSPIIILGSLRKLAPSCNIACTVTSSIWTLSRGGFTYIPWCFGIGFWHVGKEWQQTTVTNGGFIRFLNSLFHYFCVSLVSGICLHCYNKLYNLYRSIRLNAGGHEAWKLKQSNSARFQWWAFVVLWTVECFDSFLFFYAHFAYAQIVKCPSNRRKVKYFELMHWPLLTSPVLAVESLEKR